MTLQSASLVLVLTMILAVGHYLLHELVYVLFVLVRIRTISMGRTFGTTVDKARNVGYEEPQSG